MTVRGGVAAVIPVHNPDSEFCSRVAETLRQVDFVVIVDDGSDDPNTLAPFAGMEGVLVISQENAGIAAASNRGIELALAQDPGLAFILTVDQDSTLGEHYCRNAIATYDAAVEAGVRVGAVCAGQFNDWHVTIRNTFHGFDTTLEVAASGMFIPTETLRVHGDFDESLFIDCVDTEFVFRLLESGSLVVVGAGCQMLHEVGTVMPARVLGRAVKIGGRAVKFSYHSAIRRYYISRNRVVLYRKYFWSDPTWLLREWLRETRTTLLCVMFGPRKGQQLLGVLLGVFDGLIGNVGKASHSRQISLGRPQ